MKWHYLLFICCFISCRTAMIDSNQITYHQFREQQNVFASKDGNIHYIDEGEGPVIVLLHGVPTSSWLYRHMIDSLATRYRVIVPDMLGFGSSDSPKGYDIYSETQHAERLLALLDHLNIKSWTHVMHDAGGLWTWELFKRAPKRIEKLVVLNTIIYETGFNPPIRFKKGFLARITMWSYRNGITTNAMLKGLFKSGLTENTLNKIDLEGYKTPLKEGKTNGMYYFFSQTCNTLRNYQSIISKIDIPTAVIWGKNDSFLNWTPQSENVIKDLKIAKENIHLLEARHFIQEEKPKEISEIILNFLE
ncbi:MAG: alpha/beta hydrolase [Algibacter sp.]